MQLFEAAVTQQRIAVGLQQAGRLAAAAAGQCVAQGFGGHRVLLVPAARSPIERLHGRLPLRALLHAQEILQQVVIAIPDLFAIEPDDEQVGPLQRLDHLHAVLAAAQRITQRRAELVEQRGILQEAAHGRRLARQDVFEQIVGKATTRAHARALACARARRHEGLAGVRRIPMLPLDGRFAVEQGFAVLPVGNRSELQPTDPALGLVGQGRDPFFRQRHAMDPLQILPHLVGRQPQVGEADLHHRPSRLQPRDAQGHLALAGHHEAGLRATVLDQVADRRDDVGVVDRLEVIEEDRQRLRRRTRLDAALGDDCRHGVRQWHVGARLHQVRDLVAKARPDLRQRRQQVQHEDARLVVEAIQRQPGGFPAGRRERLEALRQQGRLARPGGRGHDGKLALLQADQRRDQVRPLEQARVGGGRIKLGDWRAIPQSGHGSQRSEPHFRGVI